MHDAATGERLPVRFTGSWTEFAPIAITNFLLTIVTLGIYRFWAIARERSYLWRETEVAGDPLEWTGTGKEMFVGFLIVAAIVMLPFYLVSQWALPSLVARGQDVAAAILGLGLYVALGFLGGVAVFRALRYRLSRTWWRGIRGGSDEAGWDYGLKTIFYAFVTVVTLGLAYPWTQARLWNVRWNEMEFGSLQFDADLQAGSFFGRWIALYFVPFVAIVLMATGAVGMMAAGQAVDEAGGGLVGLLVLFAIAFYLVIPLLMAAYYAKYYREAAAATQLGPIDPQFRARTLQWIGLWIGNIALAVVTLGIGILFWRYRNWKFVVTHLELRGTVDPAIIEQSRTAVPGDAEGLADAFEVGAF